MNIKLIENLKLIEKYNHFNNLVPMSREELKMRGLHNTRTNNILQLFYIDGLGEIEMLLGKENDKFDMSELWPEYMKHDLNIKYINGKGQKKRNDQDNN